jgi:hypothetical protein
LPILHPNDPAIDSNPYQIEPQRETRAGIGTRLGRSPPPVLDEIQLSGLPWSGAGASPTMFGLALHGSAVSSPSRRTQGRPITAYGDRGVVSVPLPAVSGGVSRHHASCDEGGTSPGDPRGPSTDSRQGRRMDSRLKCFPIRRAGERTRAPTSGPRPPTSRSCRLQAAPCSRSRRSGPTCRARGAPPPANPLRG